jgi:hypothetical protein
MHLNLESTPPEFSPASEGLLDYVGIDGWRAVEGGGQRELKAITEAQLDKASTPHHLEQREVIANQQAPRKPPSTQAPCTAHNRDVQSSHLQSQKELRTSPPSSFLPSSEDRP